MSCCFQPFSGRYAAMIARFCIGLAPWVLVIDAAAEHSSTTVPDELFVGVVCRAGLIPGL